MWGLLLNSRKLIEDLFGSIAKIYIFLHVSLEARLRYGLLAVDHFLHVSDGIKTFFLTVAVILLHLQVGNLQGLSVKVGVVLVRALERLVAFVRKLRVRSLDGFTRLVLQCWLWLFLLFFEFVDPCCRKKAFFHESNRVFNVREDLLVGGSVQRSRGFLHVVADSRILEDWLLLSWFFFGFDRLWGWLRQWWTFVVLCK